MIVLKAVPCWSSTERSAKEKKDKSNFNYPDHHKPRVLLLDMDGSYCLGIVDGLEWDQRPQSICFKCTRPTSKCLWLCESRPYKGSKYYGWMPAPVGGAPRAGSYIMAECPLYVEPDA